MSQDDTPDVAASQASKVEPEAMALRAQPRPVTRLNRRTLAIQVGRRESGDGLRRLQEPAGQPGPAGETNQYRRGQRFLHSEAAEYRKSGNYLTRSLVELTSVGQNTSISRINEKLKAFPAWNAKTIEDRHGLLVTLAQVIWKTSPIDV